MKVQRMGRTASTKVKSSGLLAGILAAAVALGGCSAMGTGTGIGTGTALSSSFLLSEDVREDIHKTEALLLDGQVLPMPLDEQIDAEDILAILDGKMYFNRKQGFYVAAIEGEEAGESSLSQLIGKQATVVSGNGRKALYSEGMSVFLYDIESRVSKEVPVVLEHTEGVDETPGRRLYESDVQFGDAEGRYVIVNKGMGEIDVTDTATDTVKTIRLKEFAGDSYGYAHNFKVVQNELYVPLAIGSGQLEDLYKVNLDSLKAEPVLVSADLYLGAYQPLADGKLLFAGQFSGEDGVFLYDPAIKYCTTLIGATDTDPYRHNYSFSLSPDEKHILIQNLVNEEVTIADLRDGKLENKRTVIKGYKLFALIWLLASWNPDSQSVNVKLAYEGGGSSIEKVEGIVKLSTSK
ncbi:hypothetical protein [Paenibacillus sp. NPDC058071]|uniref:hypothetical protein n=1 Tax=Paenibacillus sp. NPDC058071 TaxID=3346326 RepID=UPI0036D76256